jgi:hypothetical protein
MSCASVVNRQLIGVDDYSAIGAVSGRRARPEPSEQNQRKPEGIPETWPEAVHA